jgi:hypothetical protein
MTEDITIRVSDAEREEVAARLRAAGADGRLLLGELEDRLERAFAARTRGELEPLTADLPAPARQARSPAVPGTRSVRTYLAVMALLVAIWAVTGAEYFWPVWPALGWGMALAKHGHRRRPTPA